MVVEALVAQLEGFGVGFWESSPRLLIVHIPKVREDPVEVLSGTVLNSSDLEEAASAGSALEEIQVIRGREERRISPGMPVSWPLVGRREELAFVEEALGQRDTRGVVLAGAAGVGKSRLGLEALDLAGSCGFATSWAMGSHAAASFPFGALAHLLPENIPSSPDRGNVLRAVADVIVGDTESLFVLGVDDAHLLDDQSVALLHHFAVTGRAFLVLTVRTGEPTPEELVRLWKDEMTDWLEVQALSRTESTELVEAALGSQVEAGTMRRLWELTRGNPLFLRELILGAVEDGSLVATGGLWRWQGPVAPGQRLLGVLGSRLEELDPLDRELLEVVTLGEPLEVSIIESLAPPETVERLEGRGLLEETRHDRRVKVRPSHPLYGEIIRTQVTPARARSIHRILADALQTTGARRSEDLLRLATWHLEAGSPVDPRLFMEAARRALVLFDYPLVERLTRVVSRTEGRLDADHLLATALIGQGRFQEAEDLLAVATTETTDDVLRVDVALTRANNLHWDLGRTDAALEVIAEAERAVSDHRQQDYLEGARATCLQTAGRLREALEAGLKILHRPGVSDRAVAEALQAAAFGLVYTGKPEEGLELFDRHLDQMLRVLHLWPFGAVALVTFRTVAHFFAGNLIEGAELAEHAHREHTEPGTEWIVGWTAGLLGMLLGLQGRVRTASKLLTETGILLAETNLAGHLSFFLANLAYSLAVGGAYPAAEQALRECEATTFLNAIEGWLALPRVWVPACRGEVSTAIAAALKESDRLGAKGFRSQQVFALHDVARLGEPERVASELAEVATLCDGRLIPTMSRHATVLAEKDALSLEDVSEDFESMGAYLLAAETAAEASNLHRDAGAKTAAVRIATRSKNLADKCEGARTPALALIEDPLPLTRREREIATMAARGLSNPEIANHLVVSIRTVENHLHRAFTKLGVEGRGELGAILGIASEPSNTNAADRGRPRVDR